MIKYIIGTLLILWCRLINLKLFEKKKVPRIEPKIPWYRQLVWFYSSPTKILPNLYLGSAFNAYDYDDLKKLNINVILNITKEIDNFYQDNLKFTYYKYPINDNNEEDITNILVESCNKIDLHIKITDTILVHCYMGASRSASVIIYYLMCLKNQSYISALNYVQEKRPLVNLSKKFANTLKLVKYINKKNES